jgi:hypothetical protein
VNVSTPVAQGAVREKVCEVYGRPAGPLSAERPVRDQLAVADALVEGDHYYLECRWVDTDEVDYADIWQYLPGTPDPGPDPAALARQAYDQVPLVVPQPATSPPTGEPQVVGLPTWLWIDPAAWGTFTADATIPGLTVTVTATPRAVTWDMGDGTQVTCDGPGTPWAPAGDDGQRSDCTHTYQFTSAGEPGGRYAASATVTWGVTWAASTGEGGTLVDASRTAAFGLEVTERQAVVSYGTS